MQIAWVVTVLLVVAAGIAVLVAKQKRDVRVAREQTLRKAQTEFTDALRTASKGTNEAEWEAALRLILDKPALANDPAIAADVGILQSQLRSKLDAAQEKKGTMDGFAAIESALGNREALTVGAIEELRRKLDDLGPKAMGVGPEFVARFGLARKTLDQVYLEKAREEPKAFAAANPDKGRVALGKYAHAEDVLRQLLEKAMRDQDKEMGSLAERLYKETIQESDALCARVFTRDAIEKTPWRDLLSGEGAQSWASSPLKGFSHRIDGGVLTITGPDPGVGKEGVLSIGDREQWRDFVLDMEFTLDQGEPTLFFRMPRDTRAVERSAQYPFVMGAKGIAPGKSYTLSVSFVGSRLQEQIAGSEIAPTEEEVKWGLSRKGAVAFAIPEGTRMRITRMRIRELR
jgi:hypothetical protein